MGFEEQDFRLSWKERVARDPLLGTHCDWTAEQFGAVGVDQRREPEGLTEEELARFLHTLVRHLELRMESLFQQFSETPRHITVCVIEDLWTVAVWVEKRPRGGQDE